MLFQIAPQTFEIGFLISDSLSYSEESKVATRSDGVDVKPLSKPGKVSDRIEQVAFCLRLRLELNLSKRAAHQWLEKLKRKYGTNGRRAAAIVPDNRIREVRKELSA